MKHFLILLVVLFLTSCGNKKNDKKPTYGKPSSTSSPQSTENKTDDKENIDIVAKGKSLFTDKTCFSCHQEDTKTVGPSIKTIAKTYTNKGVSIVDFLKGKTKPIIETDPGLVSIMKSNLDSFVKQMPEDELKAIEAYMHSL